MNIQKLRDTVDLIEAEARLRGDILDMGDWCYGEETCGTVACFAGWAMTPEERALYSEERQRRLYWDGNPPYPAQTIDPERIGWKRFDLEESQADKLFFTDNWPEEFEDAYERAEKRGDALGKVAVLKDRVEHFIAMGE